MKYAVFHALMRIKQPFSAAARRRRMAVFLDRMNIRGGERIIDLGGAPEFWDDCPKPLDISILNLPDFNAPKPPPSHHTLTMLEGDACDTALDDMSFDIAFSNSVIEHVGDEAKQAKMAGEARRLAPAYWVQTPSVWFPVEAHTNMPFWWAYPQAMKDFFIRRWREKLPEWTDMVEGTTVLSRQHMQALFPDGEVWTEWKLGFVKSYVLFKRPPHDDRSLDA